MQSSHSPQNTTSSAVVKAIEQAKALLQSGNIDSAIKLLEPYVDSEEQRQETLYLLGVCYRYSRQYDKSFQTINALLQLEPFHPRAFQELGHNHKALQQNNEAINAYRQAVALNPVLLASWKNLADLYAQIGDDEELKRAQESIQRITQLPPELQSVTSMIYEDKLFQAEQLCRGFLQRNPKHVEAMRLLAQIAAQHGILAEADFLLESCLLFQPDFAAARFDYANVLFQRQRFEASKQQAEWLLERFPENPDFQMLFANAAAQIGEIEQAVQYYDQLIQQQPENKLYPMFKGHALKTDGNKSGAVAAYQLAAEIQPGYGDAYWSLANLKNYRFSANEIDSMLKYESDPNLSLQDQYQLCFSLGKHYEDQQDYDASFNYYQRGNKLKQQECQYSADKNTAQTERQIAFFNQDFFAQDFFAQYKNLGSSSDAPIFIVGLPRSGSTLLEQILDSHSLIDGTVELPNIMALAQKLGGRHRKDELSRFPDVLSELPEQAFTHFAEDYLKSAQVYRKQGQYFTDKLPNNFQYIGLIHLLFPNAKVIDIRRQPMSCCFSNFKQLFGSGQEFSYGLEEVARYYGDYQRLMQHWNKVLPGKVLKVDYEQLVDDLQGQVERILDFLGLPFEQSCIEFYRNERAVHTPSAEQVRQPIFRSGLEQWKHYQSQLAPLQEHLTQWAYND